MDQKTALEFCVTRTAVPGYTDVYYGKVRDIYTLGENILAIVVTDRISAFDHIMKEAIPFKGQILNQLSRFSFHAVNDIIPTHLLDVPHPNVMIVKKCEPLPVEIVIRGYLTGHAWRVYKNGGRVLCGVQLPDGLKEHQRLPEPILTPATKAKSGHDEDISEAEIIRNGIVDSHRWQQVREAAFRLFERGTEIAKKQGLILVDTKYEMGIYENQLTLIDEVHTSDSSRYFYLQGYEARQEMNQPQKQLSKEFLREWLMEKGFSGKEGENLPSLPDSFRWSIYQRYKELYQTLTGTDFHPVTEKDLNAKLAVIFSNYI
ncbi:MAG: phosphoribosylaminoimidazolesuccinocarboxamide synthase [Balneolaceae bacterium]|nr:MAG: phosphoribosylaminoimidazolesuccinocarboxamide synthase [Balneolaceae bacterium]